MARGFAAYALPLCCAVLLPAFVPAPAAAGPVNPDISVIGQPFMRWTDDPADPSPRRVTFDPGEVELIFDAYLNPYAKGAFTTSLGEEGLRLEEGYFTLLRGLPAGLQLKGGKYRVGFGKLNPMHPHALPFAERPRVMTAYLPGEESLDEVGVSLSGRVPLPGTFSLTAAADWLQGDTFRIAREPAALNDPLTLDPAGGDRAEEARPAFAANLSGFGMIGDRSGYELSLSATGGTNNVAAATRTVVYDAAGKLKLWTAQNSYLVVQGELLKLDREDAAWDSTAGGYAVTRTRPGGGYAYADYNFSPRFNAGLLYERYGRPGDESTHDAAIGAFFGYSLMEETTSFRIDWNHFMPGTPDGSTADAPAINTITLRAIFSMGPHKAHQF
jgi:hypothetical protein